MLLLQCKNLNAMTNIVSAIHMIRQASYHEFGHRLTGPMNFNNRSSAYLQNGPWDTLINEISSVNNLAI